MATATLTHNPAASGEEGFWVPTGTSADGDAVLTSADGKYVDIASIGLRLFDDVGGGAPAQWLDTGLIPAGSTVNSVQLSCKFSIGSGGTYADVRINTFHAYVSSGIFAFDQNVIAGPASRVTESSFTTYTKTFTTDPNSGSAWTLTNLYAASNAFEIDHFNSDGAAFRIDYFALVVDYTPAVTWWTHPTYGWYRSQAGNPSLDAEPTDPAPSSLGWLWDTWTSTTAPVSSGWWFSDSDYGGAATLIAGGRPAQPRLYTEIVAFATGSTAMLGGSPGAGCVFNNCLVYAKGGYVVGTDYPTIRVWDGTFDRQLAIVPPTSAGAVPKGVMSFLAANGTIYVSTLDSGTDSSTYTGRVFELDFESGTLSQVGAVFPTGHVPYALAWYNGQLFCGTHRRTPTAAGRIYKFRTDFSDSTWVLDRDLTSDSLGGVTSMLSFQGTLFVGTDAPAATFAKVLARDYAGTYTTSDTGSGGAAVANNGFLSMVEFSGNLYAGYWNNDATAITKIRKYNGASWSTAYTGAAGTLRPLIGFVVDDGYIFAIGGGLSLSAIVLRSSDGTSWTDLTAQVTSASSFTAVPVFGVIVL